MSGIVKPLFGAQLNLAHPLAQGLVGCWLMNEGSGKIVNDYSGQGNHGTCVGMNDPPIATSGWNAGPHGGALTFDGVDDRVNILDSPVINIQGKMTISAWIYCVGGMAGTAYYNIAAKESIYSNGFGLEIYGRYKRFEFWTRKGAALRIAIWPFGQTLPSSWLNIVGVNNGINNLIYVNNVSGTPDTGIASATSSYPLVIGYCGRPQSADSYFNGLISSVMIWNRALSTEEIAYLYHSSYCMFEDQSYQPWMRKHVSAQDYYRHLLAGGAR